jgi:hypothetical protein
MFLEEPAACTPKLFANADGHDLARCYGFCLPFVFCIDRISFPEFLVFVFINSVWCRPIPTNLSNFPENIP